MSSLHFCIQLAQGFLIGAAAFLPGVSGSSFALAFGIYGRIMETLAHPLRNLRPNLLFFLPYLIGGFAGVMIAALALNALVARYESELFFFFMGCIAGTMPSLVSVSLQSMREQLNLSEGSRLSARNLFLPVLVCILLCVLVSLAVLLLVAAVSGGDAHGLDLTLFFPGWIAYGIGGILLGFGTVIPGLSMSAILIYLGLYKGITAAIPGFYFPVIIPVCLGFLLVLALFSRGIAFLIQKAPGLMSFAFTGLAAASLPIAVSYLSDLRFSFWHLFIALCGAVFAYVMSKIDARVAQK